MKANEYLPIGSVVLLKEGDKKLMIFGIIQSDEDDSEEFDYIGVPYPEGHIDPDCQYLFYHKNIEEVFFRGYEDEERKEFVDRLNEIMMLEEKYKNTDTEHKTFLKWIDCIKNKLKS